MKILLDINLSPQWEERLMGYVCEVVHWSTLGSSSAEDISIVDYARRNDFIIMTQDLDFGAILSSSGDNAPSVMLLRAGRVNPTTMGMQVIAAIERLRSELLAGAFITIEPRRTRLTLLPLGKRSLPND